MKTYQLILAGYCLFALILNVYTISTPRKAKEAMGFQWVIALTVIQGAYVWLLWKCGAFSAL